MDPRSMLHFLGPTNLKKNIRMDLRMKLEDAQNATGKTEINSILNLVTHLSG